MYSFPEPPYFLLIAGLLVSFASGAAFNAVLKQSVHRWSKSRSSDDLKRLRGLQLLLPFLGIAAGVCVFLSSGMEIFGFPANLAYAIALPLTILIAWLIWFQLGKILIQLQEGGSKALDLDSFG
ncbi:hypothetical protein AB3R30_06520 [Leptolyngbyaceae cyanobacterium UHCC 1019]